MKHYIAGKEDIQFIWDLNTHGGHPYVLDGFTDVKVYYVRNIGKTEVENINIAGNQVGFILPKEKQTSYGSYSVMLVAWNETGIALELIHNNAFMLERYCHNAHVYDCKQGEKDNLVHLYTTVHLSSKSYTDADIDGKFSEYDGKIRSKAEDSEVVHKDGIETIKGAKKFEQGISTPFDLIIDSGTNTAIDEFIFRRVEAEADRAKEAEEGLADKVQNIGGEQGYTQIDGNVNITRSLGVSDRITGTEIFAGETDLGASVEALEEKTKAISYDGVDTTHIIGDVIISGYNVADAIGNLEDKVKNIDGKNVKYSGIVPKSNVTEAIDFIVPIAGEAKRTADTALEVAKGVHTATVYPNYATLITELNAQLAEDKARKGHNYYIITRDVPDLWVANVHDELEEYDYQDDELMIQQMVDNGSVRIGYYDIAMLETAKVDLSDYYTKDEVKEEIKLRTDPLTDAVYFLREDMEGKQPKLSNTQLDNIASVPGKANVPYNAQNAGGVLTWERDHYQITGNVPKDVAKIIKERGHVILDFSLVGIDGAPVQEGRCIFHDDSYGYNEELDRIYFDSSYIDYRRGDTFSMIAFIYGFKTDTPYWSGAIHYNHHATEKYVDDAVEGKADIVNLLNYIPTDETKRQEEDWSIVLPYPAAYSWYHNVPHYLTIYGFAGEQTYFYLVFCLFHASNLEHNKGTQFLFYRQIPYDDGKYHFSCMVDNDHQGGEFLDSGKTFYQAAVEAFNEDLREKIAALESGKVDMVQVATSSEGIVAGTEFPHPAIYKYYETLPHVQQFAIYRDDVEQTYVVMCLWHLEDGQPVSWYYLFERIRKDDGNYYIKALRAVSNGDPMYETCQKQFHDDLPAKVEGNTTKLTELSLKVGELKNMIVTTLNTAI